MMKWLLHRAMMIIPVLVLISIVAFLLMRSMQIDFNILATSDQGRARSVMKTPTQGNDLPVFYFSILPYNYPDTIYKIAPKKEHQRVIAFLRQGVRWIDLQEYLRLEKDVQALESGAIESLVWSIHQTEDLAEIISIIQKVSDSTKNNPQLKPWITQLISCVEGKNRLLVYIPTIRWFGFKNQYHLWITRILRGNFGVSMVDNRPAWVKIKEALSWTFSFNLISLVLIFLLSILTGEYLYKNVHKKRGRLLEVILLFFYSIPRFFFGILLIYLFASDSVFPALHIFPTPGFMDAPPDASIFEKWVGYGAYLVLPMFAMVIPSLAYISRLYMSRLLDEGSKPYAFWAWSRGVDSNNLVKKHLRKNAFLPILALIGMELPLLIGGSVVIEVLFNIPGMGRLMMQSILLQDWVIVFSILFLAGILTVSGKLLVDIIMGLIDKRIIWQ